MFIGGEEHGLWHAQTVREPHGTGLPPSPGPPVTTGTLPTQHHPLRIPQTDDPGNAGIPPEIPNWFHLFVTQSSDRDKVLPKDSEILDLLPIGPCSAQRTHKEQV